MIKDASADASSFDANFHPFILLSTTRRLSRGTRGEGLNSSGYLGPRGLLDLALWHGWPILLQIFVHLPNFELRTSSFQHPDTPGLLAEVARGRTSRGLD